MTDFRIIVVILTLATLSAAQTQPAAPSGKAGSSWGTTQDSHSTIPAVRRQQRIEPAPQAFGRPANDAHGSGAPPNSIVTTTTAGPVKLGPGDLIEITVFDSPELATRARVSSEGAITFPLLGRLHVGGSTPEQVQQTIEHQLATGDFVKNPQVTVFVAEYADQAVYVLGEVNKPGAYPVLGSHRLFDFVSAAGGLTARAGRSITIARRDAAHSETVRIARDPNFTADNPDIAAGDTIYVGPAGLIYVVGDVGHPGGFLMDSGEKLTLLQALALAGGVKSTASLKGARLVRTTEQGRQEIVLDLKKILAFQGNDPTLQDQDIIYVPNSAGRTGLRRGMEAALQAVVGVAIYRR